MKRKETNSSKRSYRNPPQSPLVRKAPCTGHLKSLSPWRTCTRLQSVMESTITCSHSALWPLMYLNGNTSFPVLTFFPPKCIYLLITSLRTSRSVSVRIQEPTSAFFLLESVWHCFILAGRQVGGSYPSKTKTGPGFVSFHLCVHADTDSCFELPSRCSALLFHPRSVQPGEIRVLYIQGADPAGGACLPAARQVAVRRILVSSDRTGFGWMTSPQTREVTKWTTAPTLCQVGPQPGEPGDPGDPSPSIRPAGGKAISSSNTDDNWTGIT